jgi:glycosyltransferase involved in cell wall biosynthesis
MTDLTDDSKAKVLKFIAGHACGGKLLHHPHQQNRGTSESRNLGMRHATGEFLCFLDADDMWHPEFLSVLVDLLAENAEVSMVYGPALLWHTDQDGSLMLSSLGVKTNSLVDPLDFSGSFVGDVIRHRHRGS